MIEEQIQYMARPTLSYPTPLFTVVMPCFRARDTIRSAVASVLAQTCRDFELIVVDDGSPDDSATMAILEAGDDPRVRVVRQNNAGPAAARNRGIGLGKGELIAFLDSDDIWTPDYLSQHRDRFATRPNLGVSFARVRFFDAAMNRAGRLSAHAPRLTLDRVLGENPLCTTSNLVARRAVFDWAGRFDTAMTHAEDQEWLARVLATTGWDVCGIDAVLVHYRMSAGGLSADLARMDDGWRIMMARARQHAPVAFAAAEGPARAVFERYLARRALRTGQNPAEAFAHLWEAFRQSPRAMLTRQPKRTFLTFAGAVGAAVLPAAVARAVIAR